MRQAGVISRQREETIAAFLDQLAARVPAAGGGATAALHAAQAAALLALVARYSDAPRRTGCRGRPSRNLGPFGRHIIALAGAARPGADVVRTTLLLVSLAEDLWPTGNRNLIADVAAAAVRAEIAR